MLRKVQIYKASQRCFTSFTPDEFVFIKETPKQKKRFASSSEQSSTESIMKKRDSIKKLIAASDTM